VGNEGRFLIPQVNKAIGGPRVIGRVAGVRRFQTALVQLAAGNT